MIVPATTSARAEARALTHSSSQSSPPISGTYSGEHTRHKSSPKQGRYLPGYLPQSSPQQAIALLSVHLWQIFPPETVLENARQHSDSRCRTRDVPTPVMPQHVLWSQMDSKEA